MAAFDPIPPVFRGNHFTWFLANRALLTDAPLYKNQQQRNGQDKHEQALRKVWALSGGSRDESPAVIEAKMLALPLLQRKCIKFCFILMFGEAAIPNPSSQSQTECWLDFGFVGASGEEEEHYYCAAYHEPLIERRCTWSEFCAAFESKTIPALFTRHSLSLPNPRLFADVMSGSPSPHDFKSVWRLKHYVVRAISSEPGHTFLPELTLRSESFLTISTYIELLTKRRVDPLDLHDACMRGGLLEYAKTFVKLSPWTAKYQRLLKNRYPLRGSVRHVAGTITQS
ncbi:hypothetical protein OH76DRAFT_1557530 [Lentinus brumalis]|uniref:Uncharacterized protein n=1 Tax=Lentinus brumalis TaxID=2498619 RepID=A0A371D597_9APHY|nr:hypothetical protein OH76DRAFT_1557530 [Polyporus brumalis]